MNKSSPRRSIDFTLEPLSRFLNDPNVFEVRVNKPGEVVCDTREGRKFFNVPAITLDYLKNKLASSLASTNKTHVGAINNFMLPDGSRVILCLPPAVIEGAAALAIRKHMPVNRTLEQLDAEGRFKDFKQRSMSDIEELAPFEMELLNLLEKRDVVGFLTLAVRSHLNIAVTGSTGSGKTTLTRSLVDLVDIYERIILLEDVHEVAPSLHKEVVCLQYGEGAGRITPTECLKACMRLSPERIFMTELRDSAAWDLLAGANTAHPGTIFSTHADDAASAFSRVADLVKASPVGTGLDYGLIMKRVQTTIDIVVHMAKWNVVEILYDPLQKKKIMAGAV